MILNSILFLITAPFLLIFSIIIELFKPLWFDPLKTASYGRKFALAAFFFIGWWFIIPIALIFFFGFEGTIGLANNKDSGPGRIIREFVKEIAA